MKLMHTKLPEFIRKMKAASCTAGRFVDCSVTGLENLVTAKMQSARTGKIENDIRQMLKLFLDYLNQCTVVLSEHGIKMINQFIA